MLNAAGLLGGATMLNSATLLNSEEVAAPYATQNTLSSQLILDGSRPCEQGLIYTNGDVNVLDGAQNLSGIILNGDGTQTPSLLNAETIFLPGDVVVFRNSVTLMAVWANFEGELN